MSRAAPLIALAGPTASGKTEVALEMAEALGAEILSVDSRQVFRTLDIGTAKPTPADRARVPHHLLDLIDVEQALSAGELRGHFDAAEAEVRARGREVLAVGGSGLYFRAVIEGLFEGPPARADLREAWAERPAEELHRELAAADPETAGRLSPRDRQRVVRALEVFHETGIPISRLHRERPGRGRPAILLGLDRPREDLYARINRRVDSMAALGLEREARDLFARGLAPESAAMRTVGYREWAEHFAGRESRDAALERIRMNTRRYAKRQMTWFRGRPGLRRLAIAPGENAASIARRALEELQIALDQFEPKP